MDEKRRNGRWIAWLIILLAIAILSVALFQGPRIPVSGNGPESDTLQQPRRGEPMQRQPQGEKK